MKKNVSCILLNKWQRRLQPDVPALKNNSVSDILHRKIFSAGNRLAEESMHCTFPAIPDSVKAPREIQSLDNYELQPRMVRLLYKLNSLYSQV